MTPPGTTQSPSPVPATPDPIARWQALAGAIAAGFAALGGYVEEVRRETAKAVLDYLQPVIPGNWAYACAKQFGVTNLYVAEDAPKDVES